MSFLLVVAQAATVVLAWAPPPAPCSFARMSPRSCANKLQGDGAGRESSLDSWMVAFNTNDDDAKDVAYFGARMEDVLAVMRRAGAMDVDAYATVVHVYLSGKRPEAALRVLSNMETTLSTQVGSNEHDANRKGRLIQYNKVLQGLVTSRPSHVDAACRLLTSLCDGTEFAALPPTTDDDDDGTVGGAALPFTPSKVSPDAKSFALVLEALLKRNNDADDAADLIRLVHRARHLGLLEGFLTKKMERAVGGDQVRLDALFDKAS